MEKENGNNKPKQFDEKRLAEITKAVAEAKALQTKKELEAKPIVNNEIKEEVKNIDINDILSDTSLQENKIKKNKKKNKNKNKNIDNSNTGISNTDNSNTDISNTDNSKNENIENDKEEPSDDEKEIPKQINIPYKNYHC